MTHSNIHRGNTMASGVRKSVNAVMLIVGVLLLAYGFYLRHQSSTQTQDNTFAHELITHETRASDNDVKTLSTNEQGFNQIDTDETTKSYPKLTLAEFRERTNWDNENGYFSRDDEEIYKSYSEQTLRDLASSGDVKAMFVLGDYYILEDYRPEESAKQFYNAAIHGATAALVPLASKAQIEMIRNETDKTEEGREQGVTEIMAYYKVAAMRGDPRASIAQINAYREVYKIRYKQELTLSQEQLDKIDQRAHAIYDEMQQKRYELGLGDFDNSTPDSVKKDYEGR